MVKQYSLTSVAARATYDLIKTITKVPKLNTVAYSPLAIRILKQVRFVLSSGLLSIGLLMSVDTLAQPPQGQQLRPFTVSTPSPINQKSTVSTKHIALLKDVFAKAGLELQLVHDTTGRAVNAFEGGRYDGGIFIETVHNPQNAVRIDSIIETTQVIFISKRGQADKVMNAEQLTIVSTTFGKKIMLQHHAKLLQNSTRQSAASSKQVFHILQAGRADIGIIPKPLLCRHPEAAATFEQVPMGETHLNMHLYIHKKDAALKTKLESLLALHYQPHLASINNNR